MSICGIYCIEINLTIFYPVIRNAIVVIIIITSITNSILVIVLLPRVGKIGAVVLKKDK